MTPPSPRGEIRLAVFSDPGYAHVQFLGAADGDDVLRAGREVVHHPDWRPGFTEVWDVRAAAVSVSPAQAKALVAAEKEWKELLAGSLTLVVVDRPAVRYSLQFYAQMVRPLGRRIQVVSTAAEAAGVLGIPRLPSLSETDVLPGPTRP